MTTTSDEAIDERLRESAKSLAEELRKAAALLDRYVAGDRRIAFHGEYTMDREVNREPVEYRRSYQPPRIVADHTHITVSITESER